MSAAQDRFTLDRNVATALTTAVISTFEGMIGVTPVADTFKISKKPNVFGDISGIMSVVQDGREGAMVITFPKETIFYILARAYKMEFKTLDTTVRDGVAEFTNVINGALKANLNRSSQVLQYPLPHVIIGDQHQIFTQNKSTSVTVPFTINGHPFTVILQLCD